MKFTFTLFLITTVFSISLHSFEWPFRDLDVRGIVSSSEGEHIKRETFDIDKRAARRIQNSKHVILNVSPRSPELVMEEDESVKSAETPNHGDRSAEQPHDVKSTNAIMTDTFNEEHPGDGMYDDKGIDLDHEHLTEYSDDFQGEKRSYHDLSCSPCRPKKHIFNFGGTWIFLNSNSPSCTVPCG